MGAGSTQKIADLAARIQRLGSSTFRVAVSRQLAAESMRLVAAGFRSSTDPYGQTWKPIKHRNGKPLLDTGRLRASWAPSTVNAEGFRIASNVAYAAAQQYGHTYSARSDVKERSIWQHPETGRFVGKNTKLKAVVEHKVRITHGERLLPARPMVPLAGKGLGTWGAPFRRLAARAIREGVK